MFEVKTKYEILYEYMYTFLSYNYSLQTLYMYLYIYLFLIFIQYHLTVLFVLLPIFFQLHSYTGG